MDLSYFPYRQEAKYLVPWAIYRQEEGFFLSENESPDDYLPYHDIVNHLRNTEDDGLWELIVQDGIKEIASMLALEHFYGEKELHQALANLRDILSVYPEHAITENLIPAMDSNKNGLLMKAAIIVAGWHGIADNRQNPDQTTLIHTLAPVHACLDAYPPGIRSHLGELIDILQGCSRHLEGAYLHGSLATLDFIPGGSDLDLTYILSRETARVPESLLELRNRLKGATTCFYAIDRFQHHGPYILTQKIKDNYIESYLPLAVWRKSRPILGPNVVTLSRRESEFHKALWFRRSVQHYRRCYFEGKKLNNTYGAKLFISMATLLPAVAHTFLTGRYVSKPTALEWLKHSFPDESIRDWLDRLSRIRSRNLYHPAATAENSSTFPDKESKVNAELKKALSDEPYLRLTEVCDHILGVRSHDQTQSDFHKLSNVPRYIAAEKYHLLIGKLSNRAKSIPFVSRLLLTGNVRNPGISDLDFLVVTIDNLSSGCARELNNFYGCLAEEEKAIVMHPPMAIVSETLLVELPWLFPLSVTAATYGEKPNFSPSAPEDKQLLALVHLTDFAIAMNGRLFHEMRKRKEIDVRLLLNQLGGLRYTSRLLRDAGSCLEACMPILHEIDRLRSKWFKRSDLHILPVFVEKGLALVSEVNEKLHALWQEQQITLPDSFSFRAPSTGVDFSSGKINNAYHLEDGEIIMHLSHIFSCTLLHYACLEGPLSKFLRKNLKQPLIRQEGKLGEILSRRGRLLNKHFTYLVANRLHFGFFAPFHFGWQIWKKDQR